MATVILQKADLALFSDLTQRVRIPHLTAAPEARTYNGTTIRFEGDTYPTPFLGEGRTRQWSLTAHYRKDEQDQLFALLALIELAATSPDPRLLLRTHYGQAVGLDDATAVVIFDVTPTPQLGLYIDVAFTARAVEFTLAV